VIVSRIGQERRTGRRLYLLALSGSLIAIGAIVAGAPVANAAGNVVVAISPTRASVGDRVEVLIRTFLPFKVADLGIDVPEPSGLRYPAPSGYWSVLFPWADYPFKVVASGPTGEQVVEVSRDLDDATLFRGTFEPDAPGQWTVGVTNFDASVPGSRTTLSVEGVATTRAPAQLTPPVDRPAVTSDWNLLLVLLAGGALGAAAAIGVAAALRSRSRTRGR
jgi:hypothetical protein